MSHPDYTCTQRLGTLRYPCTPGGGLPAAGMRENLFLNGLRRGVTLAHAGARMLVYSEGV